MCSSCPSPLPAPRLHTKAMDMLPSPTGTGCVRRCPLNLSEEMELKAECARESDRRVPLPESMNTKRRDRVWSTTSERALASRDLRYQYVGCRHHRAPHTIPTHAATSHAFATPFLTCACGAAEEHAHKEHMKPACASWTHSLRKPLAYSNHWLIHEVRSLFLSRIGTLCSLAKIGALFLSRRRFSFHEP